MAVIPYSLTPKSDMKVLIGNMIGREGLRLMVTLCFVPGELS